MATTPQGFQTPSFIPQQAVQPQQGPLPAYPTQQALPQQAVQQAYTAPQQTPGFQNPFLPQQQYAPQQQAAPVQEVDPYEPNKPFVMPGSGLGTTDVNQLLQQQQPTQQQPMQQQGFVNPMMPQQNQVLPMMQQTMQQVQPQFQQQPQYFQNPLQQQFLPQQQMQNVQAAGQQLQQQQQQLQQLQQLPNQNDAVVKALTEQNVKTQQVLQQFIASQTQTKNSNTPDYLSMDSSELLDLINGDPESGKPSKIKDILRAVQESAVSGTSTEMQKKVDALQSVLEGVVRQHTQAQSNLQIRELHNKYSTQDPFFQQNMLDVAALLETPAGKLYYEQANLYGGNALENAYWAVQAQRANSPQYQQAMLMQQQALAQQQVTNKLQAGMPGNQGYSQNVVPFPQMQQMAYQQQQQGPSDLDVVAKILGADRSMLGVPNVRMA